MKILPSLILSFILVGLWSCTDAGDSVSSGCTEGLEMDCTGECGGLAVVDECGICAGNNLSCENYIAEIQPIFNSRCITCHDGDNVSGLDLTSYSATITGSNNGPVIIPGDHANSLLWQKVSSGVMPPNGQLTSDQVNLIATWIDEEVLDN